MEKKSRIFVAGHRGLVGSALVCRLKAQGYENILTANRSELDLLDQAAVRSFFKSQKPEFVFMAAAKVGGIHANRTLPADFIYENLVIATNVVHAAYTYGVQKLLYLGSSCIYPKFAPQPMKEEYLLTGPLEPTNEAYAVAKIAGLKLCEYFYRQHSKCFISAMPTNLYGPRDNFDPLSSHVIPSLIRRFHAAKISGAPSVTIWGTGRPHREFLFSEDAADALIVMMRRYDSPHIINLGYGEDISIADLAALVKEVTQYTGQILFDTSKPDGPMKKLLNSDRLRRLGWKPEVELKTGLKIAYEWAQENGVLGDALSGDVLHPKAQPVVSS